MRCLFGGGGTRSSRGHGYTELPKFDVHEVEAQTSPWATPQRSAREGFALSPGRKTTRDDALCWLLQANESDAIFVQCELMRARPELFEERPYAAPEAPDGGKAAEDTVQAANGHGLKQMCLRPKHQNGGMVDVTDGEFGKGDKVVEVTGGTDRCSTAASLQGREPIVQFSCGMFYAGEDEDSVDLDIMRVGDVTLRSEVRYNTLQEGRKCVEDVEGSAVFEPGQTSYRISMNLVNDDSFNNVSEFSVMLQEEGKVNAILGRYLWRARVKVLDDDTFPTNRYADKIREATKSGEWKKIPKAELLWEYFKMNFSQPVVRRGSIKRMFAEQLHNAYFLCTLFLQVFLLDKILNENVSAEEMLFGISKELALMSVIALTVLPFALLHVADYMKHSWRVGGSSRSWLQTNLLLKFLHYTEESRATLRQGDLIMAIQRDSIELVHQGYMNLFKIARELGELFALLLFQVMAPIIFHRPYRPMTFLPHVMYPVMCFAFLTVRSSATMYYLVEWHEKENEMVQNVSQTSECYRLIVDYSKRPAFLDRNSQGIKNYGTARRQAGQLLENNMYFMNWIRVLVVAVFTIAGGREVVTGHMTLGIFLTTVRSFERIGGAWMEIYKVMLQMQRGLPAVERIVALLNMDVDLDRRNSLSKARRAATDEFREMHSRNGQANQHLPLDMMTLFVNKMRIGFGSNVGGGHKHIVQINGKVCVSQGLFVCFIGKSGEGKSTLLRLLGDVVFPPESEISREPMLFVPSHLRVLHVPVEPLFFSGTLRENLSFGVADGDADGDLARILTICRRLTVDDETLDYIGSDASLPWPDVLSLTQCCLLCTARALISNPEVLVVHKPTQPFDDTTCDVIMGLFREYVVNKGIEQDQAMWWSRRPRTCIVTSSKAAGISQCDHIVHVSAKAGYEIVGEEGDGRKLILGPHFFS